MTRKSGSALGRRSASDGGVLTGRVVRVWCSRCPRRAAFIVSGVRRPEAVRYSAVFACLKHKDRIVRSFQLVGDTVIATVPRRICADVPKPQACVVVGN